MKLSISPSNPEQSLQHSVVVEDSRDDLNLVELTDLFRHALSGMGFTEQSIEEVLPQKQETNN